MYGKLQFAASKSSAYSRLSRFKFVKTGWFSSVESIIENDSNRKILQILESRCEIPKKIQALVCLKIQNPKSKTQNLDLLRLTYMRFAVGFILAASISILEVDRAVRAALLSTSPSFCLLSIFLAFLFSPQFGEGNSSFLAAPVFHIA